MQPETRQILERLLLTFDGAVQPDHKKIITSIKSSLKTGKIKGWAYVVLYDYMHLNCENDPCDPEYGILEKELKKQQSNFDGWSKTHPNQDFGIYLRLKAGGKIARGRTRVTKRQRKENQRWSSYVYYRRKRGLPVMLREHFSSYKPKRGRSRQFTDAENKLRQKYCCWRRKRQVRGLPIGSLEEYASKHMRGRNRS